MLVNSRKNKDIGIQVHCIKVMVIQNSWTGFDYVLLIDPNISILFSPKFIKMFIIILYMSTVFLGFSLKTMQMD